MENIDSNGIEYSIIASDLIIEDVENAGIRDDYSGAVGSVGKSDIFFNEEMVQASMELDDILRKLS